MNTRKMLALSAATVLLLAACNDEDEAAPGLRTVTEIAQNEIANRTTDTGSAAGLNGRAISDADTDETSLPLPLN